MEKHLSDLNISVVVAIYNGLETAQKCIDSIAHQTYKNKQLVIIDGGSKDGTVDLLAFNREKINYWISEVDNGIYSAWNKALLQVKGDWVCFLGVDDFFWDENVLENIAKHLSLLPVEIRVAYAQVMLMNSKGEKLYAVGEPWQKIKGRFTKIMCLPHPGAMHRRSLFENRGHFDESFRIAGDYELLLRELKSAEAFFIPNLITAGVLQGGISSSPGNILEQLREVRRAQRMHGQKMPSGPWLIALTKAHLRSLAWLFLGDRLARRCFDFCRKLFGLPAYWTKT